MSKKIYTQEQFDEIESELFDAQELLESQDESMKTFNEKIRPIMENVQIVNSLIGKCENRLRGTGADPRILWEIKERLNAIESDITGKPRQKIEFAKPDFNFAASYRAGMYASPSANVKVSVI